MTKRFKNCCYIHDNTTKLRDVLEAMGYQPVHTDGEKEPYLISMDNGLYFSYSNAEEEIGCVNCGDYPTLFLKYASEKEEED